MLTEFRYTKEAQSAFRTSLSEVRDRIVDGADSRLQRTHEARHTWKDTEADETREATIRTTVTNPAGTDKIKATINVTLPTAAVDESLHGSRHSIADAGYGSVEDAVNEVIEEVLGNDAPYTTTRLRSAGATRSGVSYYGEFEVRPT